MRVLLKLGVALGSLAVGLACAAQDTPQQAPEQQNSIPDTGKAAKQKTPTGTLTGTVYCADTNLAARLAAIYLVQISDHSSGTRSAGISDLDGRYAINHVREGDYYVVAVLPGYLNWMSSLSQSHLSALTDDERKKLLAQVPSVTISANQPAELAIRLERGAEIDGTVLYDDGSPAVGLRMNFKLKAGQERNGILPQMMGDQAVFYSETGPPMTDDRGHFRVLGVPPGEYVVSASVPAEAAEHAGENQLVEMMQAAIGALDVYVGGGMRASKAETIKVTAGGASKDADITIPLSKLHTIRGQVVLKSTGQPPPAATVELLYADTGEPARMAIAPDGEFEIHYVPEGSFILRANAMARPMPEMNVGSEADEDEHDANVSFAASQDYSFSVHPDGGKTEGSAEVPLLVSGDVDHVSIAVPDPPAKGKAPLEMGSGQDGAPPNQGDTQH